jgi:hypothetical protein
MNGKPFIILRVMLPLALAFLLAGCGATTLACQFFM